MQEFWSSVSKWFNEKTSSPLYFTYIAFFVIWNWKFFQIIFLENDKLFSSPRIEYIEKNLNLHITNNTFWDFIINFGWHIIPPTFLTYLAVEYLPRIQKWAFDIHTRNYIERKRTYWYENSRFERFKTVELEGLAMEKELQKTQIEKIEKAQTQEEKWYEDYKEFEKNLLFRKFNQIVKSIYNHSGQVSPFLSGSYHRIIDIDILALAHSKDLINKDGLNNKEVIEPTEKGKFFISKYLEKHPIS